RTDVTATRTATSLVRDVAPMCEGELQMRLTTIVLMIASVSVVAYGDNHPPAIKGTVHRKTIRSRADGTTIGTVEKWGKFYRSPDGSTLTVFLDDTTGSASTGMLYSAAQNETYMINYGGRHMTVVPAPIGVTAPPGSMPSMALSAGPVQTINGVQCVVVPVKGPL